MQTIAQSPAHITGFFKIYSNGSTGAGINLAEGMKTTVSIANKNEFLFNNKKIKLVVSEEVVKTYFKKLKEKKFVKVKHETKFPTGYGLGISGAGALSLSIALNKLFELKLKKEEVIEIAKNAEIKCGTGLGDVIAENYTGLMVGAKPYPSKKAIKIKYKEKNVVLGYFGPISTKKIIRNKKWKDNINKIGTYCMKKIEKEKNMKNFIHLSRVFAIESGIATKNVRNVLAEIPEAGMAMLGETIFIPTNNPKKTEKELKKYCKKIFVAKISEKGAALQ